MTSSEEETQAYRQIRALYDDETITVYQAYSASIAKPAVAQQRLDAASDRFSRTRKTWVKPSWSWMMYRSGYAAKDKRQERILALKLRHQAFLDILARGVLTHGNNNKPQDSDKTTSGTFVNIQWDPERDIRLKRLDYRSIQIGVTASELVDVIESIEDVTDEATTLKKTLDENPDIEDAELVALGLMPVERVFDISKELMDQLRMTTPDDASH
jgi:hypothetical protein